VRRREGGEYYRRLQVPARSVELDNWGQPVAIYRGRGSDDFAHAEVYATLATIRAKLSEGGVFFVTYGFHGLELVEPDKSDYA